MKWEHCTTEGEYYTTKGEWCEIEDTLNRLGEEDCELVTAELDMGTVYCILKRRVSVKEMTNECEYGLRRL